MMFGVAPSKDLVHNATHQYYQAGYYLSGNSCTLESPNKSTRSTNIGALSPKKPVKTGDTVVIILNCHAKTLAFGINNSRDGEATVCFTNIPAADFPLCLAVLFYNNGDSVELVEYKHLQD
jgi:hypothetical protein